MADEIGSLTKSPGAVTNVALELRFLMFMNTINMIIKPIVPCKLSPTMRTLSISGSESPTPAAVVTDPRIPIRSLLVRSRLGSFRAGGGSLKIRRPGRAEWFVVGREHPDIMLVVVRG